MPALLIDAMGTLVELVPPVEPLRRELRERFGARVSAADARRALAAEIAFYRAHMGAGRDRTSLLALRRACAEALRGELPQLAGADGEELTAALLAALRFRAHDDAAPGLTSACAAGWAPVIAVSNWDMSLSDVLGRVGLAEHLDGVVTSAQAGAAKPDPAIFAQALALAGAAAAGAVHVGDSVAEDVAGARAAGIVPVLIVRRGQPPPDAGCRVIVSLRELPALRSA